jgi:hypothetical protein
MYNTFNIQKIKSFIVLEGRQVHNSRTHKGKIPSNIDQSRTATNFHKGNATKATRKLFKEVQAERVEAGASKMRKTTVPAVEIVTGASAEFWDTATQEEKNAWYKTSKEWLTDNFKDRGQLVSLSLHKDERYPHFHAIYAPVIKKLDKKTGKELRIFSAKNFMGNQVQMRLDRDSQTRFMKANGFDMKRGTDYFKEGKEPPKNLTVAQMKKMTVEEVAKHKEWSLKNLSLDIKIKDKQEKYDQLDTAIDHNTNVIAQQVAAITEQNTAITHNKNIVENIQKRITKLWLQLEAWGKNIEPFYGTTDQKLANATPEQKTEGVKIIKEYEQAVESLDRRDKPRH